MTTSNTNGKILINDATSTGSCTNKQFLTLVLKLQLKYDFKLHLVSIHKQ